ncbi:serine hydrolase [Cryptosporangium phraense]|uniref:Beta-lactamase family protein n=1 Tax=Cryptosporangium phraense TaxID=2593070 RepID=A0A545AVD4_9ACTN|nr:serine hydrolase [Cryptosporangium phraense]TQS45287.1 beta-lactamase family protein [Cryptosporangium phraense]
MTGAQYPSDAQKAAHDLSGDVEQVRYDLNFTDFDAAFTQFKNDYRVVDLHGYLDGGVDRFSVVYAREKGPLGGIVTVGLTKEDVDKGRVDHAAAGQRPVLFSGYRSSAGRSFAWVWEPMPGSKRTVHRDMPIGDLQQRIDQARSRGRRIVDVSVYENPFATNPIQFTTIEDHDDGLTEWAITGPSDSDRTQAEFESMTADGWRLLRTAGTGTQYVRLWEQTPSAFQARRAISSADLGTALSDRDADGLRPDQLDSFSRGTPPVAKHCPVWRRRDAADVVPALVADFASAYGMPAVSLAVARRGRLAYTFGFGGLVVPDTVSVPGVIVVDTGGETFPIPEPTVVRPHPVQPDRTLFRIASLTKPITAAAVLRLVEDGHLRLDDRILAPGGALASFVTTPADARISDITVRNLLQHGAGGWSNENDDPMYTRLALSTDDLVRTVLAERALDNAPGTAYAYSNFGYCLLGRLVEAVTGQTYEKHVQDDLLARCGVTGMSIANDGRPAGDVIRCYPAADDTVDPYGHRIDRMDSHGGWQATALDVLRFAVHVSDVVSPTSMTTMTTPSGLPGSEGYAAGWAIGPSTSRDPGTWSHDGVLPGATGLLQRTPDGLCLVALTNYNERKDESSRTADGLYRLMMRIRSEVDYWPLDAQL